MTYRVYVYHMNNEPYLDGHWHRVKARVRKWTIRRVLRKLYGQGWDTVSILVEANE